ncbi:TKL protein kinase [Capsaspora owczarzaki ATCC 30864]|uniref:receptor protein-tyrosine kinase n=1 Tax=Capsaspora owczarzaki (strain ATCC 30864) TaxID=595528 RepID=A0A0D2WLH2_CAPO3|nr:TKL protein kinase [Capsaspora owczarzaki ATCC 30864]
MSDGLANTNCLYNNKVCDLGQQSCSTSSCSTRHCGGSGGDEYSFIYLLCMPSAAVTLSSADFVSKTGTSGADSVACPDTSNYKIKFGVAMHETGFYYDQNPSNCLMLNNQAATYNSDILNHVACDTYDDSCNNDQFFLHAICVDVSAPSTPSITSPTQNQIVRTNSVTWTFTATDAQSGIDHYECQFSSSGAWTTCTSNQVSTLDVGTYSFQVRAVNGAGLTSSSSALTFSVACPSECATCSPSDVNVCQSCASGFYLSGTSCVSTCPEPNWGKPDGTCGDSCPANKYGDIHQSRACVSTCTNFAPANASPSTRVCVDQCPSPYYADSSNHLCVESCPAPNYFGDASRNCVTPCPDGTYGNPLSSPRVCVSACTGGYYAEPISKVCVQTCPAGTYGDGLRTPPSCSASCTSGTLKDDSTRQCVANCPANSWADSPTGSCASSCSSGLVKQNSTWTCVTACDGSLFADSSSGSCVVSCLSPTYANSLATPPSCSASCTGGRFKDDNTRQCVANCPANSWADPSTSSCASTCSVGLAHNATWSCVNTCTVGYADNSTQSCVTRCPSGTFALKPSHSCVAACPSGYNASNSTSSCDDGSSGAQSNGGSSRVAAAAGAAAAGVVVLIAIVVAVVLLRRRKQGRSNHKMESTSASIEMTNPNFALSHDPVYDVAGQTKQKSSYPASADYALPLKPNPSDPEYAAVGGLPYSTPSIEYSLAVVSTSAMLSSQIATGERKLLGRGAFGEVFSANVSIALIAPQHRHLFAPGAQTVDVAVKTLQLDANVRAEQDFVHEAELLRRLNHTNIVNVLAVLPAGRGQPQMLVLEYVPYGDLRNLLRKSAKSGVVWSLDEYVHVATGVAEGMAYLEQSRVLHRDLAARNILVGEHLVAKIADFGLSRELNDKDYYKLQSKQKLPIRWMAPETLNYRKFSSQSDVFSYGVVLWELFTMGQVPWAKVEREQYLVGLERGDRLPHPRDCPAQLYSLMLTTWEWEPSARPSFADCVLLLQQGRSPRGTVRDLGALVH